MKKICLVLFSVFMLFSVAPAVGQSSQDALTESSQQFAQWTKSLADFVRDVRFNEEDMQSFINLADDFNSFGAEQDNMDGEYVDFNTILNDPDYLSWAMSKNINSDMWLKKTMRIIAVMMQTEMEANNSEEQIDLQEQLKELEAMREQMGEEVYQQALRAMTDASAAMQGLDKAYKYLPVPTEAEKGLLAKYREELLSLE